jgi:hypothetical protein
MPCSECGHILFVNHNKSKLLCPDCLDIDIADPKIVEEKIDRDRELLKDGQLLGLLEEYDKSHLLLYLIERLNKISHKFYETRRLQMQEFAYLNHLIKIIYKTDESRFGDQYLDRGDELDDDIDLLLSSQSHLVSGLKDVEDEFRLCLEFPVSMESGRFLFGDYDLRDTEYRYSFHRCLRSLIGGRQEDVDLFDKTHDEIRDFDRPTADEIETLEDFGDTFYGFILSMLFVASLDNITNEIYGTFMPDYVSVFDLSDFLDRIDALFANEDGEIVLQDSTLAAASEEGLHQAGTNTFENNWDEVRDYVVVSDDNLGAHPFLFDVEVSQVVQQQPGRPPTVRQFTQYVYPRWYAKLLRFQIFPLLQNDDKDSGHEILDTVATDRGIQFEENLYEYLREQEFECYHSAEIPGNDSSEMDLIVVNEDQDELWFIECKFLMPETLMNTAEGIERLNEKFDHKIFNIEVDRYEGAPTGITLPETVDLWLSLSPGDRFTSARDNTNSPDPEIRQSWQDLTPRVMVVSNLVPSFVEKEGVEFRTDLELLEMVENEDIVYEVSY